MALSRKLVLSTVLVAAAACSGLGCGGDKAATGANPAPPASLKELANEESLLDAEACAKDTPRVILLLADPEPRIRIWAAAALGATRDPETVAPLVARLTDKDKHVRAWAATALGQIGDKTGVEPISPLLGDAEEVVRLSAVAALLRLDRSRSARRKYDPKGTISETGKFFEKGANLLKEKPEEAIVLLKKEELAVVAKLVELESTLPGGRTGRRVAELKMKQMRTDLSEEETKALHSLVDQLGLDDLLQVFAWVRAYANINGMLTLLSQVQERGVVLLNRSRYLAMAGENPGSFFAHFRLGQLHFWANEMQEAATVLIKATRLAPRSGEARSLLGKVLIDLERYPEAVRHVRAARELGENEEESIKLLTEKGHWKAEPSPTPSPE